MKEMLCVERHLPESRSAWGRARLLCTEEDSRPFHKLQRWTQTEKTVVVYDNGWQKEGGNREAQGKRLGRRNTGS